MKDVLVQTISGEEQQCSAARLTLRMDDRNLPPKVI